MTTRTTCILTALILVEALHCHAADSPRFRNVVCEGDYKHHLQGVCTNESNAIYWSFTTDLVETDQLSRVQRKVAIANHYGDICFSDGKL